MALNNDQLQRYTRNILVKGFGEEAQEKLLSSSVLIVGAGGLGSPAALYLAAAGVGCIGIADGDTVELSNLQRQILHGTADLGRSKTLSAAESIQAINSDVRVVPYQMRFDEESLAEAAGSYDFVIDATDNFEAKFLINDVCVRTGKPFSHAAVMRLSGQALTYVPGQGPCYRCVFKEPPAPEDAPSAAKDGIIGAVAGVMGCLQAMEAIRYLVGIGQLLCGRMLVYEGIYGEFHEVDLGSADPCCAACGNH